MRAHPLFLGCGKCPWNINGIHDEISHLDNLEIWDYLTSRLRPQ